MLSSFGFSGLLLALWLFWCCRPTSPAPNRCGLVESHRQKFHSHSSHVTYLPGHVIHHLVQDQFLEYVIFHHCLELPTAHGVPSEPDQCLYITQIFQVTESTPTETTIFWNTKCILPGYLLRAWQLQSCQTHFAPRQARADRCSERARLCFRSFSTSPSPSTKSSRFLQSWMIRKTIHNLSLKKAGTPWAIQWLSWTIHSHRDTSHGVLHVQ